MKKRSIILALVITIALATGATAYAASASYTIPASQAQRLGLGRITSMRGYDYIISILKNKLGLSDTDISAAQNQGKTLYELAAEKGMTQEQFKAALLEERSKAIDAAVSNGTITKEQGEALKTTLQNNIQNCTGNFGQGQGACQGCGRGQGRGMMGNGYRWFNQ